MTKPKLPSTSNHSSKQQVTLAHSQQTSLYVGPLPHPSDLEHYNRIAPGAAERIIAMAEKQQQERLTLEKKDMANTTFGLFSAWSITMTGLITGGILSYLGKETSGLVAILGALAPLVGSFLLDRLNQNKK